MPVMRIVANVMDAYVKQACLAGAQKNTGFKIWRENFRQQGEYLELHRGILPLLPLFSKLFKVVERCGAVPGEFWDLASPVVGKGGKWYAGLYKRYIRNGLHGPSGDDNIKTMYLPRSSRWSMTRRRRRPNLFSWAVFGLVVLFGYYFNQVYLPAQPNPFDATPTATRSAESFTSEAEQLFRDGRLLQAIDAYKDAINASPQNPTLYIALARTQVWAGRPEEAQANAENAILLSPDNAMAHAVLAWALDFQGKNSEALERIDQALALDPNNAIAHAYRVEILIDSQDFANIEKAIDVSRNALALDPDALETRRARAYLLEATQNYEEAILYYRSAIEVNPNIPILHLELGRNLRIMNVYDDAIREFTIANTLNPTDPEPDLLISRTYATIGDYAKAIQYAETAVNDRKTDSYLRGNLGVMLFRNFLYSQAVEQLRLAINGGTTDEGLPIIGIPLSSDLRIAEYYYTYGMALARTNECGEALKISQLLQSAIPNDENAAFAAQEMIRICQENLENPPTDVPTEESVATEESATLDTETQTPLPEGTATP